MSVGFKTYEKRSSTLRVFHEKGAAVLRGVWIGSESAGFVAVSAGERHSLLLDAAGHVWAVGCNAARQCGSADSAMFSVPTPVGFPVAQSGDHLSC